MMNSSGYNNNKGFTLVELMLSTLLISMLCIIVWGLLGHYAMFCKQAEDKTDLYNSLRLSLNRMSRELKCAGSISAASDLSIITFINDRGNNVSYYCLNNQLLRRENGSAAPLASYIENICFSYAFESGLYIDQTNIDTEKSSPAWVDGLSLVTVTLTAAKPGVYSEPVTMTQIINLRVLP